MPPDILVAFQRKWLIIFLKLHFETQNAVHLGVYKDFHFLSNMNMSDSNTDHMGRSQTF